MKRNKTQINVTFKVTQMIRKDVFKDSDRCLRAEATDSERCHRNWFGGRSKLTRIDALCRFNSTLFGYRVKVGNIAHMVWFAHFLFTDSAYIAHAFQCITISFYWTNVNVMSIHGVTNRPKMTTPSIVWWEGRLLFLEVVTHFWVHDPFFCDRNNCYFSSKYMS